MLVSPQDQLLALFNQLPNSEEKSERLDEILQVLSCVPASFWRQSDNRSALSIVFDCTATSAKDELSKACQVLDKLLSHCSGIYILTHHLPDVMKSLNHSSPNVREIIVSKLDKSKEEDEVVKKIISEPLLLSLLMEQIGNDSLAVAKHACSLIGYVGQSKEGCSIIFSGENVNSMNNLLAKNDVVRFRFYEVIVKISLYSVATFMECVKNGLIERLLKELDQSDVLVQLNCLQLLGDFTAAEHCLSYLDDQGFIKKIESVFNEKDSNPFFSFLLPGLLKFFGNIASIHPKMICNSYPIFMSAVFDGLDSANDSLKCTSMETLAIIALSDDGKTALVRQGNDMVDSLKKIGHLAKTGTQETRIVALTCIANLISIQAAEQSSETLEINKKWFNLLGDKPLKMIYANCSLPIVELRLGSFCVLQSLAQQQWGQEILKNLAGFSEYLVNRTTEPNKKCKEEKFKITKSLVESPTFLSVFDSETQAILKLHVNEGPFFVHTVTEIAIEES